MTTRNSNAHFEDAPQVEIERSSFDRSCNIKTSWNVGELVPFYLSEILPGDTVEIETSKVARLQTLITPVMDNLYLDTYYFFVPNRLIWEHWREFCGENNTTSWIPTVEYSIPQVKIPSGGYNVGTIADYFGVPPKTGASYTISALPFRAYCKIVNDWFRDENLQAPLNMPVSDATTTGSNGTNYITDCVKGGYPFIANKYHDYFTSCLPAPQKGPDVSATGIGIAPIVPGPTEIDPELYVSQFLDADIDPYIRIRHLDSGYDQWIATDPTEVVGSRNVNGSTFLNASEVSVSVTPQTDYNELFLSNLYADLSQTTGFTINALRQAFQIQRMLEKDARGGTRYIELIKAHFGISSPDARLQRSEYLGGNRCPLNIEQVVQTSSTDSNSPLGHTAGWSQTNDTNFDVQKSFTEHGYIIGLMCVRYDHSYQQGLERHWSRKTRYDYYWPALAHIGEQAVYTKEIDYLGDSISVFGYQEAWAEYRYQPNYITGQMRTIANTGLDAWHFADYYSTQPSLSSNWIVENKDNIDRALAVQSGVANQIFGDIYVKARFTRPMPLYSIPGLIDHF